MCQDWLISTCACFEQPGSLDIAVMHQCSKNVDASNVYNTREDTQIADEFLSWWKPHWVPNSLIRITHGWREDVLSKEWFEEIFLRNRGVESPQLLIWESHGSHVTHYIGVCEGKQYFDICFPPHTTHRLRP